jgi:hypothetical protein
MASNRVVAITGASVAPGICDRVVQKFGRKRD